jgi:hypothetical protein
VFRDVYLKERLAVPWRVLWALRRIEARGLIRGGRFVTGVEGGAVRERNGSAHVAPAARGWSFARPSQRGRRPAV